MAEAIRLPIIDTWNVPGGESQNMPCHPPQKVGSLQNHCQTSSAILVVDIDHRSGIIGLDPDREPAYKGSPVRQRQPKRLQLQYIDEQASLLQSQTAKV